MVTVVLRGNARRTPETQWTPLSKAIRYRLRRSFHRVEIAHTLQVSIPCPLLMDRAKCRRGSPFSSHDNSRVGLGATIPQARRSIGLGKLGCDLCPATLRPGGRPIQQSGLVSLAVMSADRARPSKGRSRMRKRRSAREVE